MEGLVWGVCKSWYINQIMFLKYWKGILIRLCNFLVKVVLVGYGVKLLWIIGIVFFDEEIDVFEGIVEIQIMFFGCVNVEISDLYECEFVLYIFRLKC